MSGFRFSFNVFGLTTAQAFAELCLECERMRVGRRRSASARGT
ncbi:MAG: hypothetical protein M0030_06885 [Actinomycetota bacterium]|jgi:hypothetical protein|nr:hypothetical protein [Actinomycetota bacterium]